MRDWMAVRNQYLQDTVESAGPRQFPHPLCDNCNSEGAEYRCRDCFHGMQLCKACCLKAHQRNPFHRMDTWTGGFYRRTFDWQRKIGLVISFGHGGSPCPIYNLPGEHPLPPSEPSEDDWEDVGEDDEKYEYESGGVGRDELKVPRQFDAYGNPTLIVVHTNGIHYVQAQFCRCPNALPNARQCMLGRVYPASQIQPQTVFTFHVLDDCLTQRTECKTSVSNYYSKLRRNTTNMFPHLVPVRVQVVVWSHSDSVLGPVS